MVMSCGLAESSIGKMAVGIGDGQNKRLNGALETNFWNFGKIEGNGLLTRNNIKRLIITIIQ